MGVGSVGDGFEEFFGELLVVGVEVVDGFEDEFEVVWGLAFVLVEDERVCAGVERECDVAEDVEGWGAGAGFVAADLGDVDADGFGEGVLGEAGLFAEVGESLGEGHGVYQWGWWCCDHRWAFLNG